MKKQLYLVFPLLLSFSLVFSLMAEEEKAPDEHPADMGRTYYDEDRDTVKEVYSYKEVQRFNPEEPEKGIQVEEVKNGAYFRYYRNGQLEVMGTYRDGEKHGTFTYFDQEGNKLKTVTFKEGEEQ